MDAFRILVEHVQKGRFDESRNPGAYWMGIAKNLALRELGQQKRKAALENSMHPKTPLKLFGEDRAKVLLDSALTSLGQSERFVVTRMKEGFRQKDIAHEMGKSRDQVQRIWSRALNKLRAYYRAHGWESEMQGIA